MTNYESEIIDAHVAIEDWLGRGEGIFRAARPLPPGLYDDCPVRRAL